MLFMCVLGGVAAGRKKYISRTGQILLYVLTCIQITRKDMTQSVISFDSKFYEDVAAVTLLQGRKVFLKKCPSLICFNHPSSYGSNKKGLFLFKCDNL